MMPIRLFTVAVVMALSLGMAQAAEAYWQGIAAGVVAAVDTVVTRFEAGDEKAARAALTEAYFGQFEDSKMEAAVRQQIGKERAVEVESMFGDIRSAMKAGDGAEVRRIAAALRAALNADGQALDAAKIPPEVYVVNQ